uniref:Peroxidase n=1 Tax=Anthurium amnicola TaxID=1678845 RepID=A0A1D1XTD9_9ARAE
MGLRVRGEVVVLALLLGLCLGAQVGAQLQVGYYRKTCPGAEIIVKQVVRKALMQDSDLAADFVRMHFHDCFVRGCDGSILLDSTPGNLAEKDSPINNPSLEGFEVIYDAKSKLEKACRGVVSCADIIAFAARDSVELSRGLGYEVPSGRRDGSISRSSETLTQLPPPSFNLAQLTQRFASKGLTQEDMVTLSGAHTIGVSHCTSISSRLYNFSTTASTDPSLDAAYAETLKKKCPKGSTDPNLTVPMDPPSPQVFDSSYYKGILAHRGLFESDQTLMSSPNTARQVRQNAANQYLFQKRFAEAMVKMGNIGVLTGKRGEIRLNCSVVN